VIGSVVVIAGIIVAQRATAQSEREPR
jgi:hypothetical protein